MCFYISRKLAGCAEQNVVCFEVWFLGCDNVDLFVELQHLKIAFEKVVTFDNDVDCRNVDRVAVFVELPEDRPGV